MQPLILHIPHSSTEIPLKEGFRLTDYELQRELFLLTEWYTDDLFFSETVTQVRADFSRVFCDVERFADDEKEVMSRKGMGVLYTHCDDGSLMRTVFPKLRQTILERYYIPHHRRLAMQVARDLNLSGMAMIVDCHSFPDTPLERDLVQSKPRPDINIGTDNFHTPVELIEFAKSYFAERRLVVDVDSPYSGTIVPSEYYQKNRAVFSIMIEVNRRLYLEPLTNEKCADFLKMKSMITEFLLLLKTFDQWITK